MGGEEGTIYSTLGGSGGMFPENLGIFERARSYYRPFQLSLHKIVPYIFTVNTCLRVERLHLQCSIVHSMCFSNRCVSNPPHTPRNRTLEVKELNP